MMRMNPILMGLTLCVLSTAVRADGPAGRTQGLYEITTTMQMSDKPNLPPGAMAPRKHTQCLTAKDPIPHPPQRAGQDCSAVEVKRDGDKVKWHLKCSGPRGTFEGNGTMQYQGAAFNGTVEMTMDRGGEKITVTQTMEGRRVGDCPDKPAQK